VPLHQAISCRQCARCTACGHKPALRSAVPAGAVLILVSCRSQLTHCLACRNSKLSTFAANQRAVRLAPCNSDACTAPPATSKARLIRQKPRKRVRQPIQKWPLFDSAIHYLTVRYSFGNVLVGRSQSSPAGPKRLLLLLCCDRRDHQKQCDGQRKYLDNGLPHWYGTRPADVQPQ
jgi:hypothetical protein